ncbi:MAG: sigma-54-dependent Fis family transcriptional regulator [Kiritimatiellae bacterium]|nr:sigma-54-dependent Fis family transcriptional regulator [Kiritimatiellia bacterium]
MNKTLILTGWSKTDYMTSAAAALEALKWKADVAGVSMDALAGALKDRAPDYKTVFVLGVGLKKNISRTISTLMELKTKGVRTVRLSSMPVAPEFSAEVCLEGVDPATRGFDELVDAERPSLLDVVVDYFGISEADAKFYRAYIKDVQDRTSSVGMYQTLMNAAGYLHRTRRDDSIYELAIRALSQRVKPALWDAKIKEAREDYIRFGRRELGGVSKEIAEVRQRILKAAKYERARVLILGESGTGKETVAEQIHAHSPRKNFGFVAFNCASVAKDLLEDRFFGHEKGAFTGADRQTKGLFERADHGTLFLDEIGEMPLEAQAILLRAIEEGKIIRVGGTEEISVNVRLVVATNRNLPRMVREGKFRADLYQRLSTIVINIAPLREHKEDVVEIADGFWMDMFGHHLRKDQCEALSEYDYPGNVRELINILDRARALEEDDFRKLIKEHREINRELWSSEDSDADGKYPDNLEKTIRMHANAVFKKYGGNLSAAREALGISVNTLKKYLADPTKP